MNEQGHSSTRFSLDRTKKTCRTLANGKRQQSEGEVAFKVNAGGRTGDCKINCLNTRGVLILLSVPSFSQMGATLASALAQLSSEIGQTNPFFNWKGRHMDICICHWWKICFHNQFRTKASCRGSKQWHRFWKVSTSRDGTLRHPWQTEGPVN